jgi:hypothetical protein
MYEHLIQMVKESLLNVLTMFRNKRASLKNNYDAALVHRFSPLMDEVERDILIALSRIAKHERDGDYTITKCLHLLDDLREKNRECDKKVRKLADAFPDSANL